MCQRVVISITNIKSDVRDTEFVITRGRVFKHGYGRARDCWFPASAYTLVQRSGANPGRWFPAFIRGSGTNQFCE